MHMTVQCPYIASNYQVKINVLKKMHLKCALGIKNLKTIRKSSLLTSKNGLPGINPSHWKWTGLFYISTTYCPIFDMYLYMKVLIIVQINNISCNVIYQHTFCFVPKLNTKNIYLSKFYCNNLYLQLNCCFLHTLILEQNKTWISKFQLLLLCCFIDTI